jgi:protein-S-isoprenylcysteine O-methyltransferase Ste14
MALNEELRKQGDFLFKYRSYFPLIIIVAGLYVYIEMVIQNSKQAVGLDAHRYEFVCLGVSLLGLLIRIISIGFSADNTSGRNTTCGQVAESINSSGLYSVCRHPLYVGNFFMWLGIAMLTQNFWFVAAFVFLYVVYYERIMYAEEAFLREQYGQAYSDWANHTPAFLCDFRKWKQPLHSFSWRKIIRQEKSGIFYLFLVIFLFKVLAHFITYGVWQLWQPYWTVGLVLAAGWYLVIKTIQKTTSWLTLDRKS